jgi:hypothetical protein
VWSSKKKIKKKILKMEVPGERKKKRNSKG